MIIEGKKVDIEYVDDDKSKFKYVIKISGEFDWNDYFANQKYEFYTDEEFDNANSFEENFKKFIIHYYHDYNNNWDAEIYNLSDEVLHEYSKYIEFKKESHNKKLSKEINETENSIKKLSEELNKLNQKIEKLKSKIVP